MIEEEYVNFEQAKLLKKKGFPQDYDNYYDNDGYSIVWYDSMFGEDIDWSNYIAKPTLSQVQTWLRKDRNIIVLANTVNNKDWQFKLSINQEFHIVGTYKSYEKALSAGIDRALTLI